MPRVPEVQDGVKANVSFGGQGASASPHGGCPAPRASLRPGAAAALAGVLRGGDAAAAVDPPAHRPLRGAPLPRQLRGDRGEGAGTVPRCWQGMKGPGELCRCPGRCLAVAQLAGVLAVGWLMPRRVLPVRATPGRHAPSPAALQAHAGLRAAWLSREQGDPATAAALPVPEPAAGPSPSWIPCSPARGGCGAGRGSVPVLVLAGRRWGAGGRGCAAAEPGHPRRGGPL